MIVAVTGLAREASIVAGPDVTVVVSGGRVDRLRSKLEHILAGHPAGIISVGLAAGISPAARTGDIAVATDVIDGSASVPADAAWSERMRLQLRTALPVSIAGSSRLLMDAAAKAALHDATGAHAGDMESHIAAQFAKERAIPFVALRVVSDGPETALPYMAATAVREDGRIDVIAVLRSLMAHPGDIPAVLKGARDSRAAFAALVRCRHVLGRAFSCPYLG